MTLTLAYILRQNRNALAYHPKNGAKCFVSVFHIGMDMPFIDIHRQFLPKWTLSKFEQLQITEKCIPKFDFC